MHEFCSRIRCDYKKDKDGYKKAIAKFVTTTKKLTTAKDLTVQHAMHTFGKEAYKPAVAGVKHNSGVIPMQSSLQVCPAELLSTGAVDPANLADQPKM